MTAKKNKKAKKSFCPRASTGNTHHGMRYAGSKLFSTTKVHKIPHYFNPLTGYVLKACKYLSIHLVSK